MLQITIFAAYLIVAASGTPPDCKLDVAFVIDSSRSIWNKHFGIQKDFIAKVINELYSFADLQVSALTFGSNVDVNFYFSDYTERETLLRAIKAINHTYGLSTRTYRALGRMRTELFLQGNGEREDAFHIAVVLTDGETNPGNDTYTPKEAKKETLYQAKLAKQNGIYVFAVGIGNRVNAKELQGIASDPSERFVIQAETFEELNTTRVRNMLVKDMCNIEFTTTAAPTEPLPTTTPTTTTPEVECRVDQEPADIFFLLDSSTSLNNRSMFAKEVGFVKSVVDAFQISSTATQVGVISFSTRAVLDFHLNQYTDKASLKPALDRIPWRTGNTYTDKALRMLIHEEFSKDHGARNGVEKIGILMTDGQSSRPKETIKAANDVSKAKIRMFAIGVGKADRSELEAVATNSTYVHMVESLDALDSLKRVLVNGVICGPVAK